MFRFLQPVVDGKAEGNFFKVLTEIYPKAEDSMNEELKPNSSDKKIFSLPIKFLISCIRVRLRIPPPEKTQKSIFFF